MDSPKLEVPFWGACINGYPILGVYFGVPLFWENYHTASV